MFGSHHDDTKDENTNGQLDQSAVPSAPALGGLSDTASSPPPPGFGSQANDNALDELAGNSDATDSPSLPDPVNNDENSSSAPDSDELLQMKQDALKKLSPLVGHLDQTPEEKFKTTMMMIQATDDKSKLKEAYETAQAITDEKVRAQALLDVVNEINYFTQKKD